MVTCNIDLFRYRLFRLLVWFSHSFYHLLQYVFLFLFLVFLQLKLLGSFLASLEAVGYQKGVNLFGAPFDWRVPTSIHELDESRFNQRFFWHYPFDSILFFPSLCYEKIYLMNFFYFWVIWNRFFDLIEDVAKKTGKQVDIITHSMGGHVAIEFFNTMVIPSPFF